MTTFKAIIKKGNKRADGTWNVVIRSKPYDWLHIRVFCEVARRRVLDAYA